MALFVLDRLLVVFNYNDYLELANVTCTDAGFVVFGRWYRIGFTVTEGRIYSVFSILSIDNLTVYYRAKIALVVPINTTEYSLASNSTVNNYFTLFGANGTGSSLSIAKLMVFDQALSDQEMTSLVSSPPSKPPTNTLNSVSLQFLIQNGLLTIRNKSFIPQIFN